MNLNNICEGSIIKNYKELCRLLKLDVLSGNSKKAQMNELERYFNFVKEGQKYIIEKIYDEPLERIENRGKSMGSRDNNSIYITYIETLLLHLLSIQEKQTLTCTKNYLLVALGMVDMKYTNKETQKTIAKINKFKDYEINEFNNRAYQTLHKILFSSLKNLQRRCLITFDDELHYTKINEKTGKSVEDIATKEEETRYTSIKRSILDDMNLKDLRDIYFYNKIDEFYTELRDRLYDEFLWDTSFICYEIRFTKSDVLRFIPKVEEELNQKLELNDKIIIALNNNAQTRYDNMVEKFENEYKELCILNNCDYIDDRIVKAFKPPKNYVDRQKAIAEEIVRIKYNKKNKKAI